MPLVLDLSNGSDFFTDLAKNPEATPVYHLIARIHHHGVDISSGHYTADVPVPLLSNTSSQSHLDFNEQDSLQWLHCSDAAVTPLSRAELEAPSATVYTLIYKSVIST